MSVMEIAVERLSEFVSDVVSESGEINSIIKCSIFQFYVLKSPTRGRLDTHRHNYDLFFIRTESIQLIVANPKRFVFNIIYITKPHMQNRSKSKVPMSFFPNFFLALTTPQIQN